MAATMNCQLSSKASLRATAVVSPPLRPRVAFPAARGLLPGLLNCNLLTSPVMLAVAQHVMGSHHDTHANFFTFSHLVLEAAPDVLIQWAAG
jgi:hypothetical protein